MYRNATDIKPNPGRTTAADKSISVLASLLLSMIWVGSYHYRYNVAAFNTYGINIWALFLWVLTGYITLQLHFFVKGRIRKPILYMPVTWAAYFAGLLLFEYIGYYVLHIREQSAGPRDALVFGVIHGSATLHVYYLVFPVLIWGVYYGLQASLQRIYPAIAEMKTAVFERRYKTRADA